MTTNTLTIEHIDEFQPVARLPRSAITDVVLQGIRQLNERTHIEPFLRHIISDTTDTPHNSSEIADILTHLTVNGVKLSTAFVNKGKASPKVKASDIAHQLNRLMTLKGLHLIVLTASGDIQDDAKEALFNLAHLLNARAVIVDAVDLARLFIAHHQICPRDGSPYTQGRCPTCQRSASAPIEVPLRIFEQPRYEIFKLDDVSSALKRYRADILTDPHYSRATLREVVLLATDQIRRDNEAETRLGTQGSKRPVDCVFLFVYLDLRDHPQTNWVCRSLWIRPDAPENFRPSPLNAQERLADLEIDWNPRHAAWKAFWHDRVTTKRAWSEARSGLLPSVDRLTQTVQGLLADLDQGRLEAAGFCDAMTRLKPGASQVYRDANTHEFPPYQAAEADQVFRSMLASWHNAFLPFSLQGRETWSPDVAIRMARRHLERFQEARTAFEYEYRKLGG
jgi:hypothetical protein